MKKHIKIALAMVAAVGATLGLSYGHADALAQPQATEVATAVDAQATAPDNTSINVIHIDFRGPSATTSAATMSLREKAADHLFDKSAEAVASSK